jgi:hypothetical protein
MSHLWCAVALLLSAFVAPPTPYRFRISITAPNALTAETRRVETALRRGLFLDSLIVPAADSQKGPSRDSPYDPASIAKMVHLGLIRGSITENGQNLEVHLELQDILAKTLAGPDTLRVDRAGLDSAIVEEGRRYAKALTKHR